MTVLIPTAAALAAFYGTAAVAFRSLGRQ